MQTLAESLTRSETAPVEAPAVPDVEVDGAAEPQLDPPHRVLLHNDDVTPYDFVVRVLRTVFSFSLPKALAVTHRAHVTGVAYVATYPREEAKYRVSQAHALARGEGYPLTLTIEPEG